MTHHKQDEGSGLDQAFVDQVSDMGTDQLLHEYSERYVEFCNALRQMKPGVEEQRPKVMFMRDEIRTRLNRVHNQQAGTDLVEKGSVAATQPVKSAHTPPQANDKELEAQIIKVVRPYVSNDFQEDRAVDEIVDLIHKDRAAAQQALLEELDRESEVIGVGYPVIRAEHVRKRSSMSAYTDGLTDIDPDARYNCPECKNHYSGRWIKRHLVAKHGYLYWDGYNVYKPAEAVTDGKVNTVTDLESTDSDEAKGPSNPPNNHKE